MSEFLRSSSVNGILVLAFTSPTCVQTSKLYTRISHGGANSTYYDPQSRPLINTHLIIPAFPSSKTPQQPDRKTGTWTPGWFPDWILPCNLSLFFHVFSIPFYFTLLNIIQPCHPDWNMRLPTLYSTNNLFFSSPPSVPPYLIPLLWLNVI